MKTTVAFLVAMVAIAAPARADITAIEQDALAKQACSYLQQGHSIDEVAEQTGKDIARLDLVIQQVAQKDTSLSTASLIVSTAATFFHGFANHCPEQATYVNKLYVIELVETAGTLLPSATGTQP